MNDEPIFSHFCSWLRPDASPQVFHIVGDTGARHNIMRSLDLESLDLISAELEVSPWRDGLEINGHLEARLSRLCGLTLDPFDVVVNEAINLRAVPMGSPNLPPPPESDVDLDLEAEDPPEAYGPDGVDLGALVVETLALSLDPFPRKPGAVFESPAVAGEDSPFRVLAEMTKSKSGRD